MLYVGNCGEKTSIANRRAYFVKAFLETEEVALDESKS